MSTYTQAVSITALSQTISVNLNDAGSSATIVTTGGAGTTLSVSLDGVAQAPITGAGTVVLPVHGVGTLLLTCTAYGAAMSGTVTYDRFLTEQQILNEVDKSGIIQTSATISGSVALSSGAQTDLDAINAATATNHGDLGTLHADNATVETDVNAVATAVSGVNTTLVTTNADLSTLHSDNATVESDIVAVTSAIGTTNTDLSTLHTDSATLHTDNATVETDVVAVTTALGTTNTDLAQIHTDLTSPQTIKSQLATTMDGFIQAATTGAAGVTLTNAGASATRKSIRFQNLDTTNGIYLGPSTLNNASGTITHAVLYVPPGAIVTLNATEDPETTLAWYIVCTAGTPNCLYGTST